MNEPTLTAKHKAIGLAIGLIFVIGLVAVFMGFVTIDEGSVGVEKDRGAVTGTVYQPGWNVINPITQSVVEVETRPQVRTMNGDEAITLITGDGQDMTMDMTVRYRVEPENADQFHSEYQNHDTAIERVIDPTVRSNAREEASGLAAREIITREGRNTLEESVEESLNENVEGTGITIEAVQLRRVQPNQEFSAALENVEIENTKAEQRVIEAESIAEANEIRDRSLTQEVLMEQYLEAIDDSDKVVLATGDDGTPVILDAAGSGEESNQTTSAGAIAEADD